MVVIVLVIGCAIGLGIGIWKLQTPVGASAVARLTVVLPSETESVHEIDIGALNFAMSPEGSRIAFVARRSGRIAQLYLRSIDSLDAQAVPGSENAFQPFFSPDGKWVAYCANNVLFKVSVEGPVPIKIGAVTFSPRGAAWGANNTIFLGGANRGLYRIPADGGEAVEITHPNINQGEQYHAWPDVLPDGKHVLFTSVRADGYDIGALSLETGEWHILERTEEAGQPHYVNSGHLVFFRGGGLFAAPFDLSKIAFSGPASPVLENVSWRFFAGLDLGHFSVSRSGSLLFLPATGTEEQGQLVRVDRAGKEQGLSTPSGRYFAKPSFSPDGKRVAADYSLRKSVDVWVFDLERGTRTRLTTEGDNIFPAWSADGTRIVYAAFKRGTGSFDIYWTRADGSGKPEPLLVKDYDQVPNAVSPDGRWIAFQESNLKTGYDICFLSLENRSVVPFLATPANETAPDFSPDSRFLAYASDESGRFEVYVRSISGAESQIAVSSDGGNCPRWSHKGDELFYRSGDKMMAVKISTSPKFSTGKPQPLFQGAYGTFFDVTPDGRHFLMLKPSKQPPVTQIQVILNWFEELKQRVPVK